VITDARTLRKLEHIRIRYEALRFQPIVDVPMAFTQTTEYLTDEPVNADYAPIAPGAHWGDSWVTAWFRGDVVLPEICTGRRVFVNARTGGVETLMLVDGKHRGNFDPNHHYVMLVDNAEAGACYHLAFEAYAGHTFPGTQPDDTGRFVGPGSCVFDGVDICLEREDVTAFVFDLRVLWQLMTSLDEHSLRRGQVALGLAEVFAIVDARPGEVPEETWRPKLARAREIMAPLLALRNGPTTPRFAAIGHSHMDTAWLWPLRETWRKCARTYSGVLNLMEQYPQLLFIQAAPLHAEKMRELYPDIFEGIKQRVAEGRWEPNGAMWVEPDCNIASGEAMVRQLLVGQKSTREMFGYTADTLWLPDVFGYSAALPQLLRGAGVEFFCTTKISWNDTTRFPYETFAWKGIDGSAVTTHFHRIELWPEPQMLRDEWSRVQHKDVQDRVLCTYGHGDGGGGPTHEMLELLKRVGDVEGCPRVAPMTVSAFMQSIRDDLGPRLPEYTGELYLELHRGTLTSIARVKQLNRRCELTLRDAECLCTLAALRGEPYPAPELLSLWKEFLTNQFHDILPGSSISVVNDEAIECMEGVVDRARALGVAALEALGATDGGERILLANTLSWDRDGELLLEGIPNGKGIPGAVCQWIESIDGQRRLAVSGPTVPALGARVLPLADGPDQAQSPFTVTDEQIATPLLRVRFDGEGRIVSVFDQQAGRDVCIPGGAINALLIGEDVPLAHDNWDIDADQDLKMETDHRLLSRKVVADGPLQLRIRSEYEIGLRSRLVQDMVLHSASKQIDFETRVEWAEGYRLLKAAFDINVAAAEARHEIQYGHVARPTHTNRPEDRAMFEVANQKWTDLSDNGYGVALLNDCKYGIRASGSRLALSLIKSNRHPDDRGDAGTHFFTYSLLPHEGPFGVESVIRPAYELNIGPIVAPAGDGAEDLASLLTVDAANVIVEAVKWAEDGSGFVVRLYEAGGMATRAQVTFGAPVAHILETNLLEENGSELELADASVAFAFRPFEVKTLVCRA